MKLALAAALAAAAALPCRAQTAAYRPQQDTLLFRSLNEYRMYFVRGGDTLGQPVRELDVERERWTQTGGALQVAVDETALDLERKTTHHLYAVSPRGRIATIDGDANLPRGGYDVFPVLPTGGRLAPGTTWSDTVTRTRPDSAGPYIYSAVRNWRVAGVEHDGTTRLEATGTLHYRDVYSQGGVRWWIDVSGPLRETVRFDAARGRRTEQAWSMDLRGVAGIPREGGGLDTVPAGLVSALTRHAAAAPEAALMARPLPGADTASPPTATAGGCCSTPPAARAPSWCRGWRGPTAWWAPPAANGPAAARGVWRRCGPTAPRWCSASWWLRAPAACA